MQEMGDLNHGSIAPLSLASSLLHRNNQTKSIFIPMLY